MIQESEESGTLTTVTQDYLCNHTIAKISGLKASAKYLAGITTVQTQTYTDLDKEKVL